MKRKPFRMSENIIRVISWNFIDGVIKPIKIKFLAFDGDCE
jgi:hypothetical protein